MLFSVAPSPTKHSKLEMFSNVKTQIEGIGGWLGSSIPKLRKNEGEDDQKVLEEAAAESAAAEPVTEPAQQKDDDDNSR